ncbi:MAG: universal stress protein [bacterium]|nr:universal stress protein [bacterium]
MAIRKILVPVDLSEASRAAFAYALAFAKGEGAALVIVHALYLPSDMTVTGQWWSNLRAAAIRELGELQNAAEALGVTAETEITSEHPADSIERLAQERGIDLVLIGSRGGGLLRHALLGSVATRVLATSPCPVLTLAHDASLPKGDEPLVFQRILVATDFSQTAELALQWAVEFAQAHGASLHLVNAQHLEVPVMSMSSVMLPPTLIDDLRQSARGRLEEVAERIRSSGLEVTTQVVWEPAAGAVRDAAKRVEADMIVMGTRGQTGVSRFVLGSVAERTIHMTPCPVVTVSGKAHDS